jgi:hypothetical protein
MEEQKTEVTIESLDKVTSEVSEASKKLFSVALSVAPFASDVHEVEPIDDESGFPLDKLDEYDNEFKKMYEDMFSRLDEFGTMGAGEVEMRLKQRQNELSESKCLEGNGGGTSFPSSGESSVYTSEHPTTPVHGAVSLASSRTFLHPSEAGSYEAGTEADDERAGSPVDSGSVL